MAIYLTCTCTIDNRFLMNVQIDLQIFRLYQKLKTNSRIILLHKSPHRQPPACGQRITHLRYFCFLFHLSYAILSPESQREYFYTTDLFMKCSRFVYICVLYVGAFKNRGKFSYRIDLSCVWRRSF